MIGSGNSDKIIHIATDRSPGFESRPNGNAKGGCPGKRIVRIASENI